MKEKERRERQNRSIEMQTRRTNKLCSTTSTSLSLFPPEPSAEETEPAGYSNPYTVVSFLGSFEVLNFTLDGPGADIIQMKVSQKHLTA